MPQMSRTTGTFVDRRRRASTASGFLKMFLAASVAGSPLAMERALATANSPKGSCHGYPSPQTIAGAWTTAVDYFWNNRKHGIATDQFGEIDYQR